MQPKHKNKQNNNTIRTSNNVTLLATRQTAESMGETDFIVKQTNKQNSANLSNAWRKYYKTFVVGCNFK